MKEENRQKAIEILIDEAWEFILFECNVCNQDEDKIEQFDFYFRSIKKLALEKGE